MARKKRDLNERAAYVVRVTTGEEHHPNFARIHKRLRVSPAMAAGVTNLLWSVEEIAALIP